MQRHKFSLHHELAHLRLSATRSSVEDLIKIIDSFPNMIPIISPKLEAFVKEIDAIMIAQGYRKVDGKWLK